MGRTELCILTQDERRRIIGGALALLSDTGVEVSGKGTREVGPGGDFLTSDHTVEHLRSGEHYYGGSFRREGETGGNMVKRAHERVEEILATHEPGVPEGRREALGREAERISARLRKTG